MLVKPEGKSKANPISITKMLYHQLISISLLLMFTGCVSVFMPLHASCKIQWTWADDCSTVKAAIVGQVAKWNNTDCGTGQKCRYALVSETDTVVKTTHTTPVKKYVDDQTFTFSSKQNDCEVEGYSTSETWYAVLDYGTNYCNLHNLITGAGLDQRTGYSEATSNAVCTQYSSADCEKY